MSDEPQAADPSTPATDAGAQQRALERDLRIAELEQTVERLEGDRAALREELRAMRPRTGVEAVRFELRELAKARARAVRGGGGAPPAQERLGYPLAAIPVAPGSSIPRWDPEVDILGDVRPALVAEPPTALHWDVDLAPGTVLSGAVTLRPGAWLANQGGVDLVVEVATPAGEPVDSFVMAVDPTAHERQRQWVGWEFPLGVSGPHRLTLRTQVAAGASPDYAWLVVADPRLDSPSFASRPATAAAATTPAAATRPPRALATRAVAKVRAARGVAQPTAAAGAAPTIALLLPVHDPDPGLLDRTLASVWGQTTDRWELCITDDGSTDPAVRDRLERAATDPRVRLTRHGSAQGISAATNAALALASAEFVATLDHDDVLTPDALEVFAAELAAHPETDIVYSDNDIIAAGRRFSASLKPDWSPDLMRSVMYTLHLSAYRRTLVETAGGWRTAFDGAQDHDLVLRLSERTDRIRHVQRVLYHWRAHAGSAALGELAKPLAYERGRAAIEEHLQRTGRTGAVVERLPEAGRYRARYPRRQPVTVVAGVSELRAEATDPTGGPTGSHRDPVAALRKVLQSEDRLVLVDLGARSVAAAMAATAGDARVSSGPAAGATGAPGALTALMKAAYEVAADHTVVLMEALAAPATDDALDALAGHVEAGAAAAGGILVGGEGRLLAGGIAFPQGLPVPLQPDARVDAAGRHPSLTMASNRLAVRGVVAMARAALPSAPPAQLDGPLALVALTLGAAEAGGRVVWDPLARFLVDGDAVAAGLLVWPLSAAEDLDRGAAPDPFWNAQLWPDRGDATIPESVHENLLLDVVDA